jgi:hypothetical protein
MRSLFLLVIALAVPSISCASDEDYLATEDAQAIVKASHFGIGPVFMTAKITQGDAALRRIMKKDDAIKYLIPIFEKASPEGKCYALIGFHLLAPDYFERSRKRMSPWNDAKIKTVAGCIVGDATVAEVVQAIREGRYDDEILGKERG